MSLKANYFNFAGHSSREFGLYISGDHTYNSPEREYDMVKVIGKNGSLIVDRGRFENVKLSYPAFAVGNFKSKSDAIRQWLLSTKGYQILYDTYHPDEYRKAIYSGSINFDVASLAQAGSVNLNFTCLPQRFLFSGDNLISVSSGQKISNPTKFESHPLLIARGNGTITIGNKTITITGNPHSTIYIDCESQESYSDGVNCNQYIGYLDTFPTLPPGDTGITYNGVSSLQVKPRWWIV